MLRRNDGPIGDDIVDPIGAHRRRIAQEVDLDGRCATRQHAKAAGKGKSRQIDQNIDFATANERGEIGVAPVSHIEEIFDCRLCSAPQLRAVIRAG